MSNTVLRRFRDKDVWFVQIPEKHWICPKCGVGNIDGDGLCIEADINDDLDAESEDDCIPETSGMLCYRCDSYCSARDVYAAALRKTDRVSCPCCKGVGNVTRAVAKRHKEKK